MGWTRAVAVLVLVCGRFAHAETDESKRLFDEGRELAKQERWAAACEKFGKCLELDPTSTGCKLNSGECLERQGQVRKGWLMYEEAARDWDRTNDARAKFAHERARAAAARLATLVIKLAEPTLVGLVVRIGDRPVIAQAEIIEHIDPGPLTITVGAPDRAAFTQTVTVAPSKTVVIDVPVLEARAGAGGPGDDHVAPPPGGDRHRRVVIALTLGGIGAASLLAAAGIGLKARSDYAAPFDDGSCVDLGDVSQCTPDGKRQVDRAGTLADVATGFGVVGVALAAAAVVVYVTAPRERGVAVAPTATASSLGLVIGGRF